MHGWLIQGIREDGGKFRPGDWVERLAAAFACFGADHRLRYAPEVQPGYINGEKCLMVDKRLQRKNPAMLRFVLDFAANNRLKVSEI